MAQSQLSLVYATSLDYARLTGGWVYNSRLVSELSALGWRIDRIDLPAGFPQPDRAARETASRLLAAIPDGAIVMLDQICLSPLADLAVREARRLRWVMIFHHPMALENGAEPDAMRRRADDERAALSAASLVVVTSQATADRLVRDYAVPASRIVTAEPGMDVAGTVGVRRTSTGGQIQMLAVGAVVPRKGYDVLIEALAGLAALPWRLTIVGDAERAPAYVTDLIARIGAAGLEDRVKLSGGLAQADLDALWEATDVFVASSRHEGYGMAVAEAISRGIATVTTDAGSIGGWLDPSAAVIVHASGAQALSQALGRMLGDANLRANLADNALKQAARFPRWPDTARQVYKRLVALTGMPPA